MFCFFSTSQLRVLKLATNTNEWRFAVLQWGRQAASLQACRSGFWGMGRLSKDNTIKFTWWFLPFCQYPFSPLSPAVLYERHAAGPWLLATSPRAAGCCMHPGLHILFGTPYPWAELAPLTSQPCLCLCSLLFLLCQNLWFLVCGPKQALAKILITVNLSSSWLQPSLLWSCCSPPNSSTWGLPHTLVCILAH